MRQHFLAGLYLSAVIMACSDDQTNESNCDAPLTVCDGACSDTNVDESHCGECGTSCDPGQICHQGLCELTCPSSTIECDQDCVDPLSDREFCGASGDCTGASSGVSCAPHEQCIAGECVVVCPTSQLLCSGNCVDPRTSPLHCGAYGDCTGAGSGTQCDTGESCIDGTCEIGCPEPQIVCNGQCVTPSTDIFYCGATGDCLDENSGQECAFGERCVDGVCELFCETGQIVCDDTCIDPLTDSTYCGASGDCLGENDGVTCGPTSSCPGAVSEYCEAGICVPGCAPGSQIFEVSGIIETFSLPSCVAEISVTVSGAQGGTSTGGSAGGLGGEISGNICITPGTTLSILVGQQGYGAPYACGGGGGTYVVDGTTPLFVGGGGGGGYSSWDAGGDSNLQALCAATDSGGAAHNDGGGGGGFSENGEGATSGGAAFLNGGAGGQEFPLVSTNVSAGGFGGGGGASQSETFNAGGGGGYDGGNAGNGNASTGGTSFAHCDATGVTFTPATHTGSGTVEISW